MALVTSHHDLISQARAGDRHAFAQLLRQVDGRMRSLASGLVREWSEVDDVLQDSYLRAYRSMTTFRGEAAFSTWLHTIVYRTCVEHLAQRRLRRQIDLRMQAEPVAKDDQASRHAEADAIEQALRMLPPAQAAVVILIDGDGCTYDEVAQIVGAPEGTIASRLNRGRRALRAELGDENIEVVRDV